MKNLTKDELKCLTDVLDMFEILQGKYTGVEMFSGGFLSTELCGCTRDAITIKLRWGVHSDCEKRKHVELYKLSRKVLANPLLTLREKVKTMVDNS